MIFLSLEQLPQEVCIVHPTVQIRVGRVPTARPTRGQGIDYGFVSKVDAEERRQGIRDVGLLSSMSHDTQDLYALLEDAQDSRRQYGWWRRRPMLPERLGSLDRIESGDSSGASDPS
ncbi:hypothetical protein Tco_0626111 [Tanacetum coccineum]|uniref:Guanylate kinase-like domain-containing protein n=1 Tax=Tanacetum coccineum TaxID=301880 RepID=A0ABQ4WIP9_9ASTR